MHAISRPSRRELWPLPVRACPEFPFMVALGIRIKHSPPALSGCLVRCYGSRCEDRVCRIFPARYDHFSAIRSVFPGFALFLSRERWWREFCWGVSFDSDYSGEGDASFLLFFEVCWCYFLLLEFEDTANEFTFFCLCYARCRCRYFPRRSLRALHYAQRRPLLVDLDCSSRLLHASHCLNNSDLGCLYSEEERVT